MRSHPTRREFIARAAYAGALAALAKPDLTAQRASAGMFVSLNGALTPKVSGVDKARLAAKLGFGGVDWDLGPAKTAGVDATKALFAELKIKPTIANLPMARPLPFGGETAEFREGLKGLAEDAAFVSAVGCRKMMVVLPATAPTAPEKKDEDPKGCRRADVRGCRSASEVEPAAGNGIPRAFVHASGAWTRRPAADAVHLDAAGDCSPREGLRPQHGRRARRLALASLRRHHRRHPRRRRRSHRPRPHFRREAGATRGRA